MSNRIALIDLDGVVADSTARFAKAEEARSTYLAPTTYPEGSLNQDYRVANDLYWRTAFTPSLVELDTLIDGAVQVVRSLERSGYRVLALTSRPETMREATLSWLRYHFVGWSDTSLIMKPVSQQYVKTVTWKAGVVELLVRLFSVDELLAVDDEQATQDAIAALDMPCDMKIGGSLVEALAMLED